MHINADQTLSVPADAGDISASIEIVDDLVTSGSDTLHNVVDAAVC